MIASWSPRHRRSRKATAFRWHEDVDCPPLFRGQAFCSSCYKSLQQFAARLKNSRLIILPRFRRSLKTFLFWTARQRRIVNCAVWKYSYLLNYISYVSREIHTRQCCCTVFTAFLCHNDVAISTSWQVQKLWSRWVHGWQWRRSISNTDYTFASVDARDFVEQSPIGFASEGTQTFTYGLL